MLSKDKLATALDTVCVSISFKSPLAIPPIKPSLAKDNVISYAQACCGTAYKFVPSYKNVTISIALAAVDIVQPAPPAVLIAAAEPPFTAILVVIVYPPVPLFVKIIVIACPATRLLIANVDIFAVTVVVNKPPSEASTVSEFDD